MTAKKDVGMRTMIPKTTIIIRLIFCFLFFRKASGIAAIAEQNANRAAKKAEIGLRKRIRVPDKTINANEKTENFTFLCFGWSESELIKFKLHDLHTWASSGFSAPHFGHFI